MQARLRNIARMLLVVFVMFYCGNTFFMHEHVLGDGEKIIHSHPYMPGATHSHSAAALQCISLANAALGAGLGADAIELSPAAQLAMMLMCVVAAGLVLSFSITRKGRGPPMSVAALYSNR